MDALIDKSYYWGLTLMPDLDEEENKIESRIELYQKDFLIMLFGYDIYVKLVAGYETLGTVYYKIVNGATYTVDDKTYKWDGLINDDLISPIADYAFVQYGHERHISNESMATTLGQAELSIIAQSNARFAQVLSRMDEQIQSLYWFIYYSDDADFADFDYFYDEDKCFLQGKSSKNYNAWQI